MANHVKPTKEELKAKVTEAQKKLDELNAKPSPSASPSPSKAPSASPSPSPSSAVSASASPSPSKSNGSPSASPSPSESPEDKAKKKAAASSAEAQILHSRTKKYDDAVIEAENIKEPEDAVMIAEYGKDAWEEMSDGNKKLAKKNWVNEKRFELISNASKEGKVAQAWVEKIDTFIKDPKNLNKHPELEGKTDDFKLFAMKPSRRGLDFEEILLAFRGFLADSPPKKNKGKMFEQGGSGKHGKPENKDDKLSASQGRALRKSDYNAWKEKLKAGKIRNE